MFLFAVFIGIYSYLIFFLGLFGLLTKMNILFLTVVWWFALLFTERKSLVSGFKKIQSINLEFRKWIKSPITLVVALIVLQAFVNLLGALGPELAFDALWYHLTLPKLYLIYHTIFHIPGGLLYYSDMPKLGEMLYVGALAMGNEIFAKVIHFTFGILVLIALYKLSRRFFTPLIALLVVSIFYANLVVDWESITAYIDLIRAFFEIMALWGFLFWSEKQKMKWLIVSAIMVGLAITTKVLAIESLVIFSFLIFPFYISHPKSYIYLLIYLIVALAVPLPWFLFSFIHTGNPVYPFFTHTYEVSVSSPNPLQIIIDLWNLFTHSSDPVSPIYLIFLPLLFATYSRLQKEIKIVVWYSGLSLLLWYFTPQTGGGRFILPYLPAFSLVCGAIFASLLKQVGKEWQYVARLVLFTIILVSCISIGYRVFANMKYIPVIAREESQHTFLANHLNFHFGDFYDTDYYFAKHIKPSDTVLLYGFHNLYYVDFPFIDSSWIRKGDRFNYIAIQNVSLPSRFKNWQLVYINKKTMVQLYKPPKGECPKKCEY